MELGKMNSETLISIFAHPESLNQMPISVLEEVVTVYPYFALGQLALTKKMQLSQHLMLKKAIKITAVITPNRKNIYEFLYQKDVQKSILENTKEEEPPVKIIEDTVEDIKEEPQVEDSSFNTSIEVPPRKEKRVDFSRPFDLKELSKSTSKEMDQLEKQIIGQTIEHVLASEIETNYPENIRTVEEKPIQSVTGKQKFSEWLEILDQNRLQAFRENDKTEEQVPSETEIIDSFLNKNVNIISPTNNDVEFSPSNLARLSVMDTEDYVTETLANIYNKQGNSQKAINTFKKLILKYPEKKTYFAARIKKIEQDLK